VDLVCLGGLWGWDLEDLTHDLAALESTGRWAVVLPFAGQPVCARLGSWSKQAPQVAGTYLGPDPLLWRSSLDATTYQDGVAAIRGAIAAGTVYQANLCRVIRAPLPDPDKSDLQGLYQLLVAGNPSPYAGMIRLPGINVVTASPELFLERQGHVVRSGPIKGTGAVESDLQEKDRAENVMIVDLVRNDLSRVAIPGSVRVPTLLQVQHHPGLVHLVSYVEAELATNIGWPGMIAAAFPPGSVTGAPKSTALEIIDQLEPADRGLYCGAIGWVDADRKTGCLAVAIRTFWTDGPDLCFGIGAGITWASDPRTEWQETELKAARLIALAGQSWEGAHPNDSRS
jgi:para-aminobenzoate synthetase component 1